MNNDLELNSFVYSDSLQHRIWLSLKFLWESLICSKIRDKMWLLPVELLSKFVMNSSLFSKFMNSAKIWRFFSALDITVDETVWFLVFCRIVVSSQITHYECVGAQTESSSMCTFRNVHFPLPCTAPKIMKK